MLPFIFGCIVGLVIGFILGFIFVASKFTP